MHFLHFQSHLIVPKRPVGFENSLDLVLIQLAEIDCHNNVKIHNKHIVLLKVPAEGVQDINKTKSSFQQVELAVEFLGGIHMLLKLS